MIRFDADVNRLATQLAAMVTAPTATAVATDEHLVNRTRLALRLWCRQVFADLAPAEPGSVSSEPRLADLALHPVGALRALLEPDPQPLQLRQPEHDTPDVTAANEQWRKLASAVELAGHSWTTSDPASRPTGEEAWATVADVAAVAEAGAALDRALVEHQRIKTGVQTRRESWEIGIAAHHVRRLANSGPMPRPGPLRPAPQNLGAVPVRKPGDLPRAFTNLATLIITAAHLRPATVSALAGAQTPTLEALADALMATAPPAHRAGRRRFAAALRSHGGMLSNVRVAVRTLRSIEADDPRPGLQMREIRGLVRALSARPRWAADPGAQKALLAALVPALSLTPAIGTATRSSVRSGRWLQPADQERLRWGRISPEHPVMDAVDLATSHARGLMGQLPPPRPGLSPYRSPHEILAPQLLYSDRARPHSPAALEPPI